MDKLEEESPNYEKLSSKVSRIRQNLSNYRFLNGPINANLIDNETKSILSAIDPRTGKHVYQNIHTFSQRTSREFIKSITPPTNEEDRRNIPRYFARLRGSLVRLNNYEANIHILDDREIETLLKKMMKNLIMLLMHFLM